MPGELSIVFLVDENPNVASAGLGGVVVGAARSVPDPAGLRWQAVFGSQAVWNRSTRRAGERGGGGGEPAYRRMRLLGDG